MIETEVKLKIANQNEMLERLHFSCKYISNFKKDDIYYSYADKKYRVRLEDDKYTITLKNKNFQEKIEVNEEIEFGILSSGIDDFFHFMNKLGAKELYRKTKIGEKFEKDGFILELSTVSSAYQDIGVFLEIEFISENFKEGIKEDLIEIVDFLGMSYETDVITTPYYELIKKSEEINLDDLL